MIDPQRCGIAMKSDKFANLRGGTEGPAHCYLQHSLKMKANLENTVFSKSWISQMCHKSLTSC